MGSWLMAQALVEHSLLSSIVSGFGRLRYTIEAYIGQGNAKYVFIGGAVVLVYLLLRPRR